jgi:dTDP-4-dehydrorhamnose reductase
MIKTAIIGASGFIGSHLWQSYRRVFPDCVGTSFSRPAPGLCPFDIRRPDLTRLRLEETGHQAVLITSAKSNISFCDQEPADAQAVNVAGTIELIRQIGRTSMSIIFFSSDYVFEGTTGRYADTAVVNPTTAYGRHKVIVEQAIPPLVENYLILRLSKIYGLEKNDGTILDDIARSLATGKEILAAPDQYFCPIEVSDLIRAVHVVQDCETRRVMNVCSSESWSRYEIACAMAEAMRANVGRIKKIRLHDIPALQGRPLNLTMVCSQMKYDADVLFRPLRESIKRVSANWIGTLHEQSISQPCLA